MEFTCQLQSFGHLPYFEKTKKGLREHLAVCGIPPPQQFFNACISIYGIWCGYARTHART
jgi:hypothetical protein